VRPYKGMAPTRNVFKVCCKHSSRRWYFISLINKHLQLRYCTKAICAALDPDLEAGLLLRDRIDMEFRGIPDPSIPHQELPMIDQNKALVTCHVSRAVVRATGLETVPNEAATYAAPQPGTSKTDRPAPFRQLSTDPSTDHESTTEEQLINALILSDYVAEYFLGVEEPKENRIEKDLDGDDVADLHLIEELFF
jgi:hypothetical protein